ncbi:histamine N-methyltransferase-like [Diadema setosum]|uniref:histamine N-methyltransferase-like n=1 Tax=Diadema setosum TaxID=31175 RepID=UPI003B3BA201
MENNNSVKVFRPVSLTEDLDRYTDTFMTAFWPNSEDVEVIRQWLRHDFEKEVVAKLAAPSHRCDWRINALGVGTGDGSMDEIIIEKLRLYFGKVRYTAVEPGKVIEQFEHRVHNSIDLKATEFSWKNMTYEDFCRSETKHSRKFTFISLIHSAYYFDDIQESLRSLMGSLEKGGALLIIVNRGWLFMPLHVPGGARHEFDTHESCRPRAIHPTSHTPHELDTKTDKANESNSGQTRPTNDNDLETFLSSLSWKTKNTQSRRVEEIQAFAASENIPLATYLLSARINVTSCFDESSEEGDKLLDFLTETAYLRRTAPTSVLRETLDVLKMVSKEDEEGMRYFCTACDAMLLFKETD